MKIKIYISCILIILLSSKLFCTNNDIAWTRSAKNAGAVRAIAISPDNRTIGAAYQNGFLILWETLTGNQKKIIARDTFELDAVAFSPDNKIVATGGKDKLVRLWNAETGDTVMVLKDFQPVFNANVIDIAFSKDGKYLFGLSAAKDRNNLMIWDWQAGTLQKTINIPGSLKNISISPTGNYFATSQNQPIAVKLWDAKTFNLLDTVGKHSLTIRDMAFAPNGQLIASASDDGNVLLRQVFIKDSVDTFKLKNPEAMVSVAFSPDSKYLVAGTGKAGDLKTVIWKIDTKEVKYTYPVPSVYLALTWDSKYILTAADSLTLLKANWEQQNGVEDNYLPGISQCYPNPAINDFTIKYKLYNPGMASITIYNSLGVEIALRQESWQDTGEKSVSFSTRDMPSGIYFYRLQSGDAMETRQVVVLK